MQTEQAGRQYAWNCQTLLSICMCRDIFLLSSNAVTLLGILSLQACTSVAGSKSLLHKLGNFSPNAGTQLIYLNAPFSLRVHSFLVLTLLPS